ncbi:MAG: glutamate--tRNA ligase [Patescibacteria group bacterium]|nr:glutamate--tRNA ligase [Patescibacteria group bacterium]
MHIGGARTALFNFLFAHHNKGKIILRIEDTDQKRFVKGAQERLIESLKWLGIYFDDGPYIQSQRIEIYQKYAQELVEKGAAYYCFCSPERLDKMREMQAKNKQAPMYDRTCLQLTKEQIKEKLAQKIPYVIRLKVPSLGKVVFNDLIRGKIEIDNSTIDDQVLMKSDGLPTYHLANVVDFYLMQISHVFRGEEWLPSTPKHILIYQAFGWLPPQFGHIPLILASDKSKLSKRHGAVSVEEFKKLGYLPEALVNCIALLGWNPKDNRELFTLTELIKEFDITKINKAGAIFDIEKLNYFNKHYINKMDNKTLISKLKTQNSKFQHKTQNLDKIITVIKSRMVKLTDFAELAKPFLQELKYNPELLIFKKSTKEATIKGLKFTTYNLQLTTSAKWNKIENLNKILLDTVKSGQFSNGDIFWPVRVALSGLEKSPSPTEMLWVLGKEESLKRIKKAINYLK